MIRIALAVLAAFGFGGRRVLRRGAMFALAAAGVGVGVLAGDASAFGKRKKMTAMASNAAAVTDCGCGGDYASGSPAGGGYFPGTAYSDATRYGNGSYAPGRPNAGLPFTDGGGQLRPVPIPYLPNR